MGSVHAIRRQPPVEGEDLVEACRRGDREALQTVLSTHSQFLERLLYRVAGASEVEDLLQMTFIAAIRAFPNFRGEAQVRTWLARIAIRVTHDRFKRAEHRRRGSLTEHQWDALADGGPDPERQSRNRDQLERLQHHLEAIGHKKRTAFVLHVFEGHSMEEVAALTDATVAATKSRVFWARRELLARAAKDPQLKELASRGGES